jgi:mannosyltransferase
MTDTDSGKSLVRRGISALATRTDWLAILLVLLGTALRFYRLGARSFWLDEVFTANAARAGTWSDLVTFIRADPDQMPMMYLITWLMRGLHGQEWLIRLPSAAAGGLTVGAVYLIGRAIDRPWAGLLAALLMATSPFAVWYGQEARPYSLFMLLTTVQMLLAYRTARDQRWSDAWLLGTCSALNLYTHYFAILMTAAAFAYAGLVVLFGLFRTGRIVSPTARPGFDVVVRQPGRVVSVGGRSWVRGLGVVALAATVTMVAYAPWVPFLSAFLGAGNVGLGRVAVVQTFAWSNLKALLDGFGFKGFLFQGLLGVGFASAVIGFATKRWRETALLVLWILVPAAALWWKTGWAWLQAVPRYSIFFLPVGLLLVALGVDGICRFAATVGNRQLRPRRLPSAAIGVLLVALLLQVAVPELKASYARPKEDYRAAARLIAGSGHPDTVVLALGQCAPFVVRSLEYYFWREHSAVVVVRGLELDDRVFNALGRGNGDVWGAVFTACQPPDDVNRSPQGEFELTRFPGVVLAKEKSTTASRTAFQRAAALLHWGSAFEPELASSAALLTGLKSGRFSENLLPVPGALSTLPEALRWRPDPGTRVSQAGQTFVLRPDDRMVNVTISVTATPGEQYLLSFSYLNGALKGEQRVYVTANRADGSWADIFPNGGGYLCSPAAERKSGTFGFTVPPQATSITLWLRATGTGTASYDSPLLRRLQ